MALTARDVAEYFLTRVDAESGDSLSNLKLQKLVYYAQGYHLALFGKPLFNERIEAWEHGPVIPDLYRIYEQNKSQSIPPPDNFDPDKFDTETRELLEEVFEVYGQFSASKLRNIAHAEKPWSDAYSVRPFAPIEQKSMEQYFKNLLVDA